MAWSVSMALHFMHHRQKRRWKQQEGMEERTIAIAIASMGPARMVMVMKLPQRDRLVPILHDGNAHLLRDRIGHGIAVVALWQTRQCQTSEHGAAHMGALDISHLSLYKSSQPQTSGCCIRVPVRHLRGQ